MTPEPPYSPPGKKRRTGRIVLVVVAAMVALCCVGGIGGGVWLFLGYADASRGAQSGAEGYIDDMMAGDYSSAYSRLCQKMRDRHSEDRWTGFLEAAPEVVSYEVLDVAVNPTRSDGFLTVVTMRLVHGDGGASIQTFDLVNEDDQWRICP